MAIADSWHLRSCSHQCSVTGRKFEADEPFYTAIFPDPESEAFERRDFSEEAWNARDEEAEEAFSFWRSVYKARPESHKPEMSGKESPETLLRRLVEEDEDHTENVRYILAVMLERRKLLVETDSQQTPSGLLRIYEHRKDGDIFIVKDPQIPLREVDRVQEEVRALLEPKPEPVASDPSDPSDQSDPSDLSDQSDQSDPSDPSDRSDLSDPSDLSDSH